MADVIVVPAGKIYFDPLDATTQLLTGELYLGNTPGAQVSLESTNVDHYSSDGPVAELDVRVSTKVARSFKFKCDNISDHNLALFFVADYSAVAQTGATVTNEAILSVLQDRTYQIGLSANPTGRRGISAVTVSVGATPMTVNVDYTIDAARGRIYIVPGGAIIDGDDLDVDYTYATNSRIQHVTTVKNDRQFGALRFLADNSFGPNRDIYIPRSTVIASGEMEIKREGETGKVMEMAFDVGIFRTGSLAQIYVDGQAA